MPKADGVETIGCEAGVGVGVDSGFERVIADGVENMNNEATGSTSNDKKYIFRRIQPASTTRMLVKT